MATGDSVVVVQLTEAGRKLANGENLRICAGKRHFLFEPGKKIQVERDYEWNVVLRNYRHHGPEQLVELVPELASEPKVEAKK